LCKGVKNNLPKEYQLLLKIDNSMYKGSIINPYGFIKSTDKFNKNIKTYIYYNITLVYSEKNNLEYSDYKINEYNLTRSKQNNIKYFIEKIIMRKSKKSNLGKISESTLFKGSNFVLLHIRVSNNKLIKFVVVNSHLYFSTKINTKTGKTETGYKKREKEFNDLLIEFQLEKLYSEKLYSEKYNIFFCGDLNFRLNPDKLNISKKNNKQAIINRFNNISKLDKQGINTNKNIIINELYSKISNNIIMQNFSDTLLHKFFENAKIFGIYLTCKIEENKNKTGKSCSTKIGNGMYTCEDKGIPRIPSMCDKILVSTTNKIEKIRSFYDFIIN
jgi:hypothetical protein